MLESGKAHRLQNFHGKRSNTEEKIEGNIKVDRTQVVCQEGKWMEPALPLVDALVTLNVRILLPEC